MEFLPSASFFLDKPCGHVLWRRRYFSPARVLSFLSRAHGVPRFFRFFSAFLCPSSICRANWLHINKDVGPDINMWTLTSTNQCIAFLKFAPFHFRLGYFHVRVLCGIGTYDIDVHSSHAAYYWTTWGRPANDYNAHHGNEMQRHSLTKKNIPERRNTEENPQKSEPNKPSCNMKKKTFQKEHRARKTSKKQT